jgi:hypothetical protein
MRIDEARSQDETIRIESLPAVEFIPGRLRFPFEADEIDPALPHTDVASPTGRSGPVDDRGSPDQSRAHTHLYSSIGLALHTVGSTRT